MASVGSVSEAGSLVMLVSNMVMSLVTLVGWVSGGIGGARGGCGFYVLLCGLFLSAVFRCFVLSSGRRHLSKGI